MAPPATEPERPTFGQRPALGNRPPSSSAEGLPPAYPPPPETERLAPPAARPVSAPNSGHLGRDSAEIMDAPLPPAFPSQPPARPTPAPQAPPPADLDAPLPPPLPFARHNAPAPPPDTEDNWSEPEEEPTFKLKRPSIEVALPPKKPLPPLPVDLDAPPPMKLALERAEPTEAPEAPPTESPEAPQPRPDLAPPETTDDWAHAIPPSEVPDEALAESELSAAAPAEEPPRRKKGAIPVPLIAMLALSAVLVIGFTVGKALLGPGGDPTPTASVTATPTWTPPPPPPPPPPATATPIFGPATPSASPSPETSPEPVASVTPETSPSASASPGNVAVDPGYPVLGPEDQEPDPNAVLPDPPTPELQPDNSIKVDVPDLGLSFQVPSGMEIKRNNWGRQKADLNWKKSEPWGESRMTVQIRMGKPGPRLRATAESMLNNQWTSVAHEGPDQVNLFRPNGRGVAFFGQTVREDGHQIFIVITYSWDGNLPKEGFEQAVGEVRRRMTLPE